VVHLRVALSAVAAILVGLLLPLLIALRGMGGQKAIGLGAIGAGLLESAVSPWIWLIVVVLFALFLMASQLSSKVLRVLLFWTPTIAISTLGIGIFALMTCVWMFLRKG
jgi:hypothetical protein